jgi:hypothetical protein
VQSVCRVALAWLLLLGLGLTSVESGRAQALQTLTYADNGSTVTVAVGDSIQLQLATDGSWDVAVSDAGVLTAASGPLPPEVRGRWQAVAPGQVSITANGGPICAPATVCPQLILHFQATVFVIAGSSAPDGRGLPPGYDAPAAPEQLSLLHRWQLDLSANLASMSA